MFVPRGSINNIPALVQIMAWHRPCDKPSSEPMMVSLLMQICVARPQWVTCKQLVYFFFQNIVLFFNVVQNKGNISAWNPPFQYNELIIRTVGADGLVLQHLDISSNMQCWGCDHVYPAVYGLIHWGRDQIDTISQTTFSNAFSRMKMNEFRLGFHWSLFLRFELTIFQHWFR